MTTEGYFGGIEDRGERNQKWCEKDLVGWLGKKLRAIGRFKPPPPKPSAEDYCLEPDPPPTPGNKKSQMRGRGREVEK